MLRAAQRSVPDIMIDDGLQTLGPISHAYPVDAYRV